MSVRWHDRKDIIFLWYTVMEENLVVVGNGFRWLGTPVISLYRRAETNASSLLEGLFTSRVSFPELKRPSWNSWELLFHHFWFPTTTTLRRHILLQHDYQSSNSRTSTVSCRQNPPYSWIFKSWFHPSRPCHYRNASMTTFKERISCVGRDHK